MGKTSGKSNTVFRVNAITAIMWQLAAVASGIILPRLILNAFGSEVNGLVSSITQFLSYISVMEAGATGVMRAAMYKPLATRDWDKLSGVVNASKTYLRKIAYIFAAYLLVIAVVYPLVISNGEFSFEFVFWLILIMGINTFAQYFFDQNQICLLNADQKLYLVNLGYIFTTCVNLGAGALLIWLGANIHTVKLTIALLSLIRPFVLLFYVKKNYRINPKTKPDNIALSQRWDGLGHQVAYYIHKNTDAIVLTLFRNFGEVSVYAVYNMVISAVQMTLNALSSTVTAKFGNLYARGDKEGLEKTFSRYETWTFFVASLLYAATSILIVPFVKVYTKGVTDANYIQYAFAILIVFAEYIFMIRAPYSSMAFAAGKYRDTRNASFIEAGINVGLSLLLVSWLGLTGVAVGTLISMAYRTIAYVIYLSKHIMCRPIKHFVKNLVLNVSVYVVANLLCYFLIVPMFAIDNFFTWVLCAAVTTVITGVLLTVVHLICNRKAFLDCFKLFF